MPSWRHMVNQSKLFCMNPLLYSYNSVCWHGYKCCHWLQELILVSSNWLGKIESLPARESARVEAMPEWRKTVPGNFFFLFSYQALNLQDSFKLTCICLKMIPAECWGVSKRDHRCAALHVLYTVYCVYAVLYIIKQIHPVFWWRKRNEPVYFTNHLQASDYINLER